MADMKNYIDKIQDLEVHRDLRKNLDEKCPDAEKTSFLVSTVSLNFLGHGADPQATSAASKLQQLFGGLTVRDLLTAQKLYA